MSNKMVTSWHDIYNSEHKGLSKYLDDPADTMVPQPPDALLLDLADICAEMDGDIQTLILESKNTVSWIMSIAGNNDFVNTIV